MKPKKINLENIEPVLGPNKEYFNRFFVCNDYCPQQVIEHFFGKYGLIKSRTMVSHLYAIAAFGRMDVNYPIETDDQEFAEFRVDLEELLNALYFENKYNKKKAIIFVLKGGVG